MNNHQSVLNSITLIVDTFISQSKSYESVSVVESMLKWNVSHLDKIALDIPAIADDCDIAVGDLRRIAKKTIQRLTNSGDSARLPAGAPVEAETVNPSQVGTCETVEAGQGGTHEHHCLKDDIFVGVYCECPACMVLSKNGVTHVGIYE